MQTFHLKVAYVAYKSANSIVYIRNILHKTQKKYSAELTWDVV